MITARDYDIPVKGWTAMAGGLACYQCTSVITATSIASNLREAGLKPHIEPESCDVIYVERTAIEALGVNVQEAAIPA